MTLAYWLFVAKYLDTRAVRHGGAKVCTLLPPASSSSKAPRSVDMMVFRFYEGNSTNYNVLTRLC